MKFNKNDEAVSPVIGVILMVAITVILAAVIAAFVFGMAGGISKTKNVAATVQRIQPTANQWDIVFTYQGGADADTVITLTATVDGVPITGDANWILATPAVGATATDSATAAPTGKQHAVVTAEFSDGSEQVILDTQI